MESALKKLFLHNDWANRECLGIESEGAKKVFHHLIGTEWLWYARIQGEEPRMKVWPSMDRNSCEKELTLLRETWAKLLADLDPETMSRRIAYVNSKGESWENSVEEILYHTLLHGSYHRGQIATLERQAGKTPPYTDYIHCLRSGLL